MAAVRKIAILALRVVLVLAILGQLAYLARRPLLEGQVRARLADVLEGALGGEVRLGPISGNWITSIGVDDISLAGGTGVVRALAGASLRVEVDPVALLRGDLGGLEQLALRADELTLDLTAEGAAEEPAEPGAPPDLAALSALLPEGARIAVDRLVIDGAHAEVRGPVRLDVPPHAADAPLRLEGTLPGADLEVAIARDGAVHVSLRSPAPFRWARLFTELPGMQGGRLTLDGTLRWAEPVPRLEAALELEDARYRDQPIDRVAAHVDLDPQQVRLEHLAARSPGVELTVGEAAVALGPDGAPQLETLQGSAHVAVQGLAPFADLLPAELRQQLPIRGDVTAHAEDGWIVLEPSFVRTAALDVEIGGGRIPLVPDAQRPPTIELFARITDPERLPLPEGLTVLPRAGAFRTHLERAAGGGVAGSSEIDLAVHGPGGGASRLSGTIGWRGHRDAWTMTPDLRLEGALARELGRLAVAGEARLDGDRLRVPSLRISAPGAGVLRVSGAADLSRGDLPALLQSARVQAELDALDLGRWSTLAGLPYGGELGGSLRWEPGTAQPLVVALDGVVTGLLREQAEPTRVRLRASTDADGTRLSELHVENDALLVDASGALPGLGSAAALVELAASPGDILSRRVVGRAELRAAELGRLALEPLTGLALTGGIAASAQLEGRLDAPDTRLEVVLADAGVAADEAPLVDDLNGGLRLQNRRLAFDAFHAALAGVDVALEGALVWQDRALVTEGLIARLATGGEVAVDGRIGAAEPAGLIAALREDSRVELRLAGIELPPWAARAGVPIEAGRADGEIVWAAEGSPRLDAQLRAEVAGLPGLAGRQLSLAFAIDADRQSAAIDSFALRSGAAQLSGRVALPGFGLTQLFEAPQQLPRAALDGRLELASFDLALLAPVVALGDLGGRVDGTARVAGTVGDPQPRVDLTVRDGRVRLRGAMRITDIAGGVAVTRRAVELRALHAELGEGPVVVDGSLTAPGELLDTWEQGAVDLTLRGENALLHRGSGVKLRGDLDLTVKGPVAALDVRGRVVVHSSKVIARIPFVSIDQVGGEAVEQGIMMPGLEAPPPVRGNLQVEVVTDDPIEVSTNLFSGKLALALQVIGPLDAPVLVGTVSGVEGTLSLPGARLQTTTMLFRFSRENPRFPEITLNASGRRHGIDVQMTVRGPYNAPEILLSSNPPLPTEDLLVLVTTGALPETLRERGAAGAASIVGAYLVEELANYLFGSESTEAKESFIDSVSFESGTEIGADGTENLVLEVRIREPFYLQGERDVYKDVNLGVVYKVRLR